VSTPLADAAARDRIRDDLDVTFVVEAAAGTGKTTALVERMVALVTTGRATLDRVAAVTFTDAAAGELRLRLRAALEAARHERGRSREERGRLGDAIRHLEAARIGTIHGFCADLLRQRPVEAHVDPHFQVATDLVKDALIDRVFDRWFEEQLADPGPGVRRILRRRPGWDGGPREALRRAAESVLGWRDHPTAWAREPFDRDEAIDAILTDLDALGPQPRPGDDADYLDRSLSEVARFMDEVHRRESEAPRDYDGLEAALVDLQKEKHWRWKGRRGDAARVARREARNRAKAALDRFVDECGADLAPALREDLWPMVERYAQLKERAGCLDFLDLLVRARDLVRDDAGVRGELQRQLTHLFVDEFQDTDPLQAELLLLLAADDPAETSWERVRPVPGKLFLVGDPKQSIYRFRRADVALYERVKALLAAGGAEVLHLTVSFRATPSLQAVVNAAFAPRMTGGDGTQARYVPLEPSRVESGNQPSVVALPVPEPYGDFRSIVDFRIDQSTPDSVAAFVAWLVRESGWTVTDREHPDARLPVAARHVCLLFRRMQTFGRDVTRPYVDALEARGLRHVLVGGSSFHEREEIEAVRTALGAIERLGDELSLFATLRGPLFALEDGVLLAYRHAFGTLHPFRALPAKLPVHLADVGEALAVLRDLHRMRNRRPLAETIARLLAATRAQAGLAIWPAGEQALANVGRLLDMARRADRQGITSFRAFVERLEREAGARDTGEAPLLEDGADGVRIMTVHKAKGLEFPVVVLADLTAKAVPAKPSRWIDGERHLAALALAGCAPPELRAHAGEEQACEQAEADRILYVATTRARDLVVVPVIGDARYEGGWLSALDPVLYPPADRAGVPRAREAPGCPRLAGDAIGTRPANVARPQGAVVAGLHAPESGSHDVVWWSPAALELGVERSVGLSQQRLLQADEEGVRSAAGMEAHAAWQDRRAAVRDRAGRPSVRVVTATERAAAVAAEDETADAAVGVEHVEVDPRRPRGARFGSLVHAVLAVVPFDADRQTVARLADLEGRLSGSTSEERRAAALAVEAALAHPLMRRAAVAGARREVPIAAVLDDGALVEGVVDAAFPDEDGWVVVDFKTDAELGERLGAYRAQVGIYARAIAEATGRPCRGVLLRV
jgi:ATP-dependent helicase/nuclease subunit A